MNRAAKVRARTIYTWNLKKIAPDLANRIRTP
jgi:hypothetical protein